VDINNTEMLFGYMYESMQSVGLVRLKCGLPESDSIRTQMLVFPFLHVFA